MPVKRPPRKRTKLRGLKSGLGAGTRTRSAKLSVTPTKRKAKKKPELGNMPRLRTGPGGVNPLYKKEKAPKPIPKPKKKKKAPKGR